MKNQPLKYLHQLLQSHPCQHCLQQYHLQECRLQRCHLQECHLQGCHLQGCHLQGCLSPHGLRYRSQMH
ncbi:MAG: pentapeptide repeat-containing protein [Lachnospiraceae bacterium]|nr:pentapeptide repeat-containing protein [Lachnospiraceae bacterium]